METYLVVPKGHFIDSVWSPIYNSVLDSNRPEGGKMIAAINKKEIKSISLSAIDGAWTGTDNPYYNNTFWKSNGRMYSEDSVPEETLFFILITGKENHFVIRALIVGFRDIVIMQTESKLFNDDGTKKPPVKNAWNNLMKDYKKAIELKGAVNKTAEDIKKETRAEVMSEMLNQPISNWLSQHIPIDQFQSKIDEMAKDYMAKITKPIVIKKVKLGKKHIDGLYHSQFPKVMELIQLQEPLFIYGQAGSGKTRICIDAAKALNLEYRTISVNEQSTKTDFLGYYDAHSNLIRTSFRDMYENGGVFILDEIDAGNPNVLTVLNSALSNGVMAFPDGMIHKHENFICICTANTTGDEADIKYVGRNILDGATLDRFIRLKVDYDREMENQLISQDTKYLRDRLLEVLQGLESDTEEHILSSRTVLQIDKLRQANIEPREAIKLATNFPDHILDLM